MYDKIVYTAQVCITPLPILSNTASTSLVPISLSAYSSGDLPSKFLEGVFCHCRACSDEPNNFSAILVPVCEDSTIEDKTYGKVGGSYRFFVYRSACFTRLCSEELKRILSKARTPQMGLLRLRWTPCAWWRTCWTALYENLVKPLHFVSRISKVFLLCGLLGALFGLGRPPSA